ncbi:NAD(P)-binding domain-containing protein, partial [Nocardia farcinica]|uniref:NAD(P)-binding domain-containing protein n=1 Tax=Nocardia farcinica TaxID=37329 RepID=UPI002456A660
MSKKIGFLGLGHMGAPMAANLVKAGHDVLAYDPVPAAQEQARADGATVVATAAAAAAGREIVITMLPNGKLVLDVYADLLPAAAPGTLFIDCSTIDVADAKAAAERAVAAGQRAQDAPVSGGVAGAAAGTQTFKVGGAGGPKAAAPRAHGGMGGKEMRTRPRARRPTPPKKK